MCTIFPEYPSIGGASTCAVAEGHFSGRTHLPPLRHRIVHIGLNSKWAPAPAGRDARSFGVRPDVYERPTKISPMCTTREMALLKRRGRRIADTRVLKKDRTHPV